MKVGDRVRLTGRLVNPGSKWMPVEEGMEPGLEGEICYLCLDGPRDWHSIGVRWDNGRGLNLLPDDPFFVVPAKEEVQ